MRTAKDVIDQAIKDNRVVPAIHFRVYFCPGRDRLDSSCVLQWDLNKCNCWRAFGWSRMAGSKNDPRDSTTEPDVEDARSSAFKSKNCGGGGEHADRDV